MEKNHRKFCCCTIYERDQQTDIQNFTADYEYNNKKHDIYHYNEYIRSSHVQVQMLYA